MFEFESFSPEAQHEAEAKLSRGESWFFRLGQRIYIATYADYVSGGIGFAVRQGQKRTDFETLASFASAPCSMAPELEAELG